LVGVPPDELKTMPRVMERVKLCKENRLAAPDKGRQKLAETPTIFRETKNPRQFIAVPEVSSENRRYIPMDFLNDNTIISNKLQMIENATFYHFGVLESNVHMAWVRAVCGRLEMRYDYSQKIVYNNFPWPSSADAQKQSIEQTAQGILDVRAKFPDASLADLYDETLMPPELRKAHQANDRAVMAAYNFDLKLSEADCVARLMKMYQELTRN
ncbi:MAG: class I SAM-dependent DNA methyltransferase, partial [Schwartzia sp.]|nr:class I SAM-dependent DNA methyltransferase [Schwartzia sp. (in: firmicutes)]